MATEASVPSIPSVASVPASSRFANRELSWLDFDARVLALAEDNTRPLLERVRFLGDLLHQPRRVLPDPGRRAEGTAVGRTVHDIAGRDDGARAAGRDQPARPDAHEAPEPDLGQERATSAGRRRGQRRRLGGPGGRRPGAPAADVREAGLPDPHAAVRRPRPSVPLHLGPVVEPGRRRARPLHPDPAVRAGEGSAQHRALHAATRRRTVHPAGAGDRREPRPAVPGDGDRRGAPVPRHPRPRPRSRDRRGRRPAGGDRVDPAAAGALSRGRAARGARLHAQGRADADRRGTPRGSARRLRDPLAAGHERPDAAHGPGSARPQVRTVGRRYADPAAARGERHPGHLRRDHGRRRPGPSSVRRVLDLGRAVRVAGVTRSRGPGDQADPVPNVG